MNILLDVPVGKWRYLNPNEMLELNLMLTDSVKATD